MLEPRNPYLSRALPYLIGCRQFMEDDYVGLGSLSDSEENGVNKNLILSSDSESEMDTEHKNISKKRMRVSRWSYVYCIVYRVSYYKFKMLYDLFVLHISMLRQKDTGLQKESPSSRYWLNCVMLLENVQFFCSTLLIHAENPDFLLLLL